MTNIRRFYLPESAVFITAVCHGRAPLLKPVLEKERLLRIFREVKQELPFHMLGYVIMDDHFHCLIRPEADFTFSQIVQSVKLRYTHRYKSAHEIPGRFSVWQRRFWDHVIRDHDDLQTHLDYIHFNRSNMAIRCRPVPTRGRRSVPIWPVALTRRIGGIRESRSLFGI